MREFTDNDYKTAFGYLKIAKPSSEDYKLAKSMYKVLQLVASPKSVVRAYDAESVTRGYYIADIDMRLESDSLARAFGKVEKIAITASTLGEGVDKKIAYYGVANTLNAMFLDALASVMIEFEVDEAERKLREKFIGYEFSARFSCGYGDLPLALQPSIIDALGAKKLIGLGVNSANIMSPLKSITSFIGMKKTI